MHYPLPVDGNEFNEKRILVTGGTRCSWRDNARRSSWAIGCLMGDGDFKTIAEVRGWRQHEDVAVLESLFNFHAGFDVSTAHDGNAPRQAAAHGPNISFAPIGPHAVFGDDQ